MPALMPTMLVRFPGAAQGSDPMAPGLPADPGHQGSGGGVRPHPAAYPGVLLAAGVQDIRPWLAHAALSWSHRSKDLIRAPSWRPWPWRGRSWLLPGALGGYLEQVERDLWLAGRTGGLRAMRCWRLHPLGTAVGRAARARILANHSWEAGLARLDAVLEGGSVFLCGADEARRARVIICWGGAASASDAYGAKAPAAADAAKSPVDRLAFFRIGEASWNEPCY